MSIFSISCSSTSALPSASISRHNATSASSFLTCSSFKLPSFQTKNLFLRLRQNHSSRIFPMTRGEGRRPKSVVVMSFEAGIGVMGNKLGMMSYFEPDGVVVPVTVVGFKEGNVVTQIKTDAIDGYNAVQVGYQRVRDRKLTKPEMGHLLKVGAIPLCHLQEFRLQSVEGFEPNQHLVFDEIFKEGDLVDVSGITIGKGFQGAG